MTMGTKNTLLTGRIFSLQHTGSTLQLFKEPFNNLNYNNETLIKKEEVLNLSPDHGLSMAAGIDSSPSCNTDEDKRKKIYGWMDIIIYNGTEILRFQGYGE